VREHSGELSQRVGLGRIPHHADGLRVSSGHRGPGLRTSSEAASPNLTAPFLWENELKTLDCGTKKVTWLLAIPISELECRYLREHSDEAFERLLEEHDADVFDPERPSVV